MKFTVSRTGAAALAAALFVSIGAPAARAQAPDSLLLQAPANVRAWSVYNPSAKHFLIWVTWDDTADDVGTFVSPPDTTGWSRETAPAQLTVPAVTGPYNGDIDRTLVCAATRSGEVGVDELVVSFEIRREEHFSGRLTIPAGYVPGTFLPLVFENELTPENDTVDFGLDMSFSAGRMDNQGTFIVGLEDFEGFHIWRGIERDGSDLEVIGELSKEEAFKGRITGGSLPDSLYFYDIVPTLRASQPWIPPFGVNLGCIGSRIDLDLQSNQFFWFDCNGTNGFTYYYAVTTFDRGYSAPSGSQGLSKYDSCPVEEGIAYPCRNDMKRVSLEVDSQDELYNVYVVPNPVRTGTSRLTTDNYHNFPDGLVRFVNLPPNCSIKIYTISGDLVWINDHADGTGNVEWDIRNLENEEVASGVYMYRIEADGNQVFGRIVVIR